MANINTAVNTKIREIISSYHDDGRTITEQQAFMMYFFELVEDVSSEENLNVNNEKFPKLNIAVEGMYINHDETTINIYASRYDGDSKEHQNIKKEDFEKSINGMVNAVNLVIDGKINQISEVNYTYELLKELSDKLKNYEVVLNFMTNLVVPSEFIGEDIVSYKNIQYAVRVYDEEDIESRIDYYDDTNTMSLKEKFGYNLEAIRIATTEQYDVYMSVVRGETLARLYKEDNTRLLENNVRAYLKKTSRVNKGIQDTIRNNPQDFVAYNNGLATVATRAKINRLSEDFFEIEELENWQIVNGGQTTATLYECSKDGDNLEEVRVPCKLTVMKSLENIDELIGNISTYSNTQTVIKKSDPLSALQYYRDIEKKSKEILANNIDNSYLCFFERINGQYNTARRMCGNTHIFDKDHPKKNKFTKIDLAKAIICWEQMPHVVNKGQEKCFEYFSGIVKNLCVCVDDEYYKKLYACVLLFREIDNIVKGNGLTYKSNVTTYTLALLSLKTEKKINLLSIWRDQKLSDDLYKDIRDLTKKVHAVVTNPPNKYVEVRMWSRKEECWEDVQKIAFNQNGSYLVNNETTFFVTDEKTKFINDPDNLYNPDLWSDIEVWNNKKQILNPNMCRMIKALRLNGAKKGSLTQKQIEYAKAILVKVIDEGYKYKK